MNKLKSLFDKAASLASSTTDKAEILAEKTKSNLQQNKDELLNSTSKYGKQVISVAGEFLYEGRASAFEQVKGLYVSTFYSQTKLNDLQNRVENQGAMYRELLRSKTAIDALMLGGESYIALKSFDNIPELINNAYMAAYPAMSTEVSFSDKINQLESEESILGFTNAIKGKLFEQEYVRYLNNDNLPEGYTAVLADKVNQAGWDIQILGSNNEVAQLLQAKATDSVSYVQSAIERYPSIDVVTTEEVYSHLVMAGVGENISNSGLSETVLSEQIEQAIDSASIDMDFAPPILTLAFIAFTSYKAHSLTLFEKAKLAGSRSGQAYVSYLVGGSLAVMSNTWWIGVLGSVSSRFISDKGLAKLEVLNSLNKTYNCNISVIDRMRSNKTL